MFVFHRIFYDATIFGDLVRVINPSLTALTLVSAPCDIGAGVAGSRMGPEALLVAGLDSSLETLGLSVTKSTALLLPERTCIENCNRGMHLNSVSSWCRGVYHCVQGALRANTIPVLLGGDHSLAIGSIFAVAEHCASLGKNLWIIWLDAHTDFNTPKITPSGNIHGMPAAVITGTGPDELLSIGSSRSKVKPEQLFQVGIRSIDKDEVKLVQRSGIKLFDMRQIDERGIASVMREIFSAISQDSDAHLHLSFDVDFLDPTIAPGVSTPVPGGANYREAQLCMERIYDSGLLGSADLVELNPARDHCNQSAELVIELMMSLFGKRIFGSQSASGVAR